MFNHCSGHCLGWFMFLLLFPICPNSSARGPWGKKGCRSWAVVPLLTLAVCWSISLSGHHKFWSQSRWTNKDGDGKGTGEFSKHSCGWWLGGMTETGESRTIPHVKFQYILWNLMKTWGQAEAGITPTTWKPLKITCHRPVKWRHRNLKVISYSVFPVTLFPLSFLFLLLPPLGGAGWMLLELCSSAETHCTSWWRNTFTYREFLSRLLVIEILFKSQNYVILLGTKRPWKSAKIFLHWGSGNLCHLLISNRLLEFLVWFF